MVKVGDRVRVVGYNGLYKSYDSHGTTGIVTRIHDNGNIDMRTDKGFIRCGHPEDFSVISPEPPQKITQNGYEYSLVGPVKPEWLVDGAWVVHKDSGDVMRLAVLKYAIKAYDVNGRVKFYGDTPKNAPTVFRPFTNSDWKWGMWAEYRGEKVFVCENSVIGVCASKKTDAYFFIPYEELTPTTAP